MAVEVLALLLCLSAADGQAEVRAAADESVTEPATETKPKPADKVVGPKKTTKKAAPAVSKRAKKPTKKPVATKKDPSTATKPKAKKGSAAPEKPAKAASIKPEDAEIIEHLEFLMLLDLLQDFELFEEDPS